MAKTFYKGEMFGYLYVSEDGGKTMRLVPGHTNTTPFEPAYRDSYLDVVGVHIPSQKFSEHEIVDVFYSPATKKYYAVNQHSTFEIGQIWQFKVRPYVKPVVFRGALDNRVARWGAHAVRGAENLKVGRAYRYIYGNGFFNEESYANSVFVVTAVHEDGFEAIRVDDKVDKEWRLGRDYDWNEHHFFVDAGVEPFGRKGTVYNCNWIVPAHTQPA